MSDVDSTRTVGELVAERPSRSRVFQQFGLDFCCGGGKTVQEAAAAAGIDPDTIVARLREADQEPGDPGIVWPERSMTELIDHIEERHHTYLKQELPRLQTMADKVARVHGEKHPAMVEVASLFGSVRAELEQHLAKEEQILFPVLRRMEAEGDAFPMRGSIEPPVQCMESEHDDAGQALDRFKQLTSDFTPPEGACNTFRALLDGLKTFDGDMREHVHKENNILFPKARTAEAGLRKHN